MKKSRFSEAQIVNILKEGDSESSVIEVCRKYAISPKTFYGWRTKYRGMSATDLKRLKELEAENAKLKKMFAELSLEKAVLKEIIEKKL